MTTFFSIKERKAKVILILFSCLILFYFLIAIVIGITIKFFIYLEGDIASFKFTIVDAIIIFTISALATTIHFYFSVKNAADKILSLLSAEKPCLRDTYHKRLKNIVEEVQIAGGIQNVEVYIIPTTAMNAFALEDFKKRKIIGLTEGALSKLKKEEVKAVLAHEISHIISGDCLLTTISCVIFNLYSELLKAIGKGIRKTRGGQLYLIVSYIILSISQAISFLMRMIISRKKEYRADAFSVQLTRDPLSLAGALYKISRGWKGQGIPGESLSPIFIMPPSPLSIDEAEGIISNIFSTHPPVKTRIKILLGIAHSDLKTLEDKIKQEEKIPIGPIETPLLFSPSSLRTKWFATDERGTWHGPLGREELFQNTWFHPYSWIKREGEDNLKFALDDELLNKFFQDRLKGKPSLVMCPLCKIALSEILYEGAPIYKCELCSGMLLDEIKISRVISRHDMKFSEEVIKLSEIIPIGIKKKDIMIKTQFYLLCPSCKKEMVKRFYSAAYPIEIDWCYFCGCRWFEKNELELLQYLVEKGAH